MPESLISKMQMEIPQNKFEGFVLAGGKSSRMGTSKAFLKIENETFIERAVNALKTSCNNRVKIILNQNQSAVDFAAFDYTRDIYPERGAIGGIHTALSISKSEWTIILACDLPLVTDQILKEISKIALDLSQNFAAVVPKQTDGKIQPLCALYRSSLCLPQLTKLLQTQNSVSVRSFLETVPTFYIENNKISAPNKTVFFNVNTPEDYRSILEK